MLGVLLAGIVAMQVEVLKMGASVGRSLAYSSQLQSQNEQLRASVASLGDDQRIMRLAAGMGMVVPHTGMVGFLSPLMPGLLQAAAGNIHAPDATTFLNSTPLYPTPTNGEVVTASSLAETAAITAGGVTTSPATAGIIGQSTSGTSPAGTSTTQSPALVQSPGSGSGTSGSNPGTTTGGGGSGTGTTTGGPANTGTGASSGGGLGTGTTSGGGTGTPNGGGTPSGGGASLTGGTGVGGSQSTPSGG
jgi:hypothetical protein